MERNLKNKEGLLKEIEDLKAHLEEAEETLRAMRSAEAEALAVQIPQGDQVLSLKDTDRIYRTERKRMEEELTQAHKLLEAVAKGTEVIIAAQDTNFRYTFFNDAYEEEIKRLTGKDIQIGTSMVDVFAHMPEQQEIAVREWSQVLRGESTSKTIEFGDPSRHRRFYSVLHTPIRDSGGTVVGAGEVAYDVTEQVLAGEAVRKSKERFELLSETASRLLSTEKPKEIVNELCQKVMEHLDCHAFFNYLVDEDKGCLHLNAYAGIPEEVGKENEWLDYGEAVSGCAARDSFRIVCENIPEAPDPRTELVKSFGIKAYVCHPLFSAGRVIGTLSFGTRSRTSFAEDELSLMKTVADQVAMAMERIQLIEALRKSRNTLEIRVRERSTELANAYKELKEQSRFLESFFKYTVTPLVFLDQDFNFIRVNEAYAKACRRDVSEFPGHNHFEFYPSDAKKKFEQAVETREPYVAISKPFTFPDHPEWGTSYWDWTLTPILDDKGQVEYLIFALEDVTERVRTEKERTRLAHIVEATSDLVGMATSDKKLFYLNIAGRKMLGIGEEEDISGVTISDTHPDWAKPMVLNEGIPSALQAGLWTGETAFLSRDGTEIPASQVILAHRDQNGEVEFLSSIARNITERKRAQKALEAERQRFNDVLEMLPAYLVLLTPDYHVPFANRFFRERFGESHGQRCFEYLFGRSEPCEICETYTALKTMAPHEWEWTGPDGRNYAVFDFPFTDTDGSTLILEMGLDITERKRTEEACRESEGRLRHLSSQLLTVQENERKRISREIHDSLGQSLSAIKFKVEDITHQMRESRHKKMANSLETLLPIIQTSIEESRRIQMDLRPSVLDDLGILPTLEWFCREYQKIYTHIRIEKGTNIKENDLSPEVKTVIFRVMQEALNNIAKHSNADLVSLSLKKKEGRIELTVQDNGMGFELQEIISHERSERGLGLTSMRERTELSGGTFVMESTIGQGTTIKAAWPI